MARNLCKGRKKTKLTHRSRALKGEIGAIKRRKKSLSQQKEAVRKQGVQRLRKSAISPYTSEQTILLIGEGNFSFAKSLLHLWDSYGKMGPLNLGRNLLATSYDSKNELYEKYPDVKKNITEIRKKYGANVLTKIDGTNITKSFELLESKFLSMHKVQKLFKSLGEKKFGDEIGFDKVIFNFPHMGLGIADKEKNAQLHKEFLTEVANNVWKVLNPEIGEFHLTMKRGEPYKNWKAGKLIERTGKFKISSTIEFFPSTYPGYAHRRTSGENENAEEDNEDITKLGAYTLVFRRLSA
eukprot:maker-scaffold_5-snap-gene-11.47-mRNA-1 protein AED:0.00 eAED:0.00 QI:62/1/1/1/1/1/3/106/295